MEKYQESWCCEDGRLRFAPDTKSSIPRPRAKRFLCTRGGMHVFYPKAVPHMGLRPGRLGS